MAKKGMGDSGSVHKRFKGNIRGYGGVADTGQKSVPGHMRGPQNGAGPAKGGSGAKQFRDKG